MNFSILKMMESFGHEAYFAGGCVRDTILGLEPKDFDIATSATPDEVKFMFDHVVDIGGAYGTVVAIVDGIHYEITTFRTDGQYLDGRHPEGVKFGASAYEDAQRRDFTINGLFMDSHGEVTDYVGGVNDLSRGIIRAIGDPIKRFSEDRLRLLRAIRFGCRFGFSIENKTMAALLDMSHTIREVSMERIRDEVTKMLVHPSAGNAMTFLKVTEMLGLIMPELNYLSGCTQSPDNHPEGDVWQHTLLMLAGEKSPELAWSCLLHDAAKPESKGEKDGKMTFYGHAETGASMAQDILRRLKFGNDFVDTVSTVVGNHMDHLNVKNMKLSTLKKMLSRSTYDLELEVHRRDALASNGDLGCYEYIVSQKAAIPAEVAKPPCLLTGKDLIQAGFKPGPLMGKVLAAVYEAQLEGSVSDKDSAMELAKTL